MTHYSGITPNENLLSLFSSIKSNKDIRTLTFIINNEEMEFKDLYDKKMDWKKDYDATKNLFTEDACLYALTRLSDSNDNDWTLLNWIPESAPVDSKMLYASSRYCVRRLFGDSYLKHDIVLKDDSDLTLESIQSSLEDKKGEAYHPQEEETNDHGRGFGLNSKTKNFSGLAFEFSDKLSKFIEEFSIKAIDYIKMVIVDEKLDSLDSKEKFIINDFARVNKDESCYHLFRHDCLLKDGTTTSVVCFLYYNSSIKASIKDRMLYTSGKAQLVATLKDELGIKIDANLETDDYSDITSDYIRDVIYPEAVVKQLHFTKPKPPGRFSRDRP